MSTQDTPSRRRQGVLEQQLQRIESTAEPRFQRGRWSHQSPPSGSRARRPGPGPLDRELHRAPKRRREMAGERDGTMILECQQSTREKTLVAASSGDRHHQNTLAVEQQRQSQRLLFCGERVAGQRMEVFGALEAEHCFLGTAAVTPGGTEQAQGPAGRGTRGPPGGGEPGSVRGVRNINGTKHEHSVGAPWPPSDPDAAAVESRTCPRRGAGSGEHSRRAGRSATCHLPPHTEAGPQPGYARSRISMSSLATQASLARFWKGTSTVSAKMMS